MRRGVLGRISFFLAVLAAVPPSCALDPSKPLSQYHLDVWHSFNGLPQESVRAIVQTTDGYLWLGTQAGLARFDGQQFRTWDTHNTPAFPRDHILVLKGDSAGGLWIGIGGGGLVYAKNGSYRVFGPAEALPRQQIRSILLARDGAVWIGTEGDGLHRFDGRRFNRVDVGPSGRERIVRCLLEDAQGGIWAGTDGGLKHISGGVVKTFTRRNGLLSDAVWALALSRRGELWIGTRSGGLNRMAGDEIRSYGAAQGLPNPTVLSILEDKDDNLWVGTDGGGLVRFNQGRFAALSTASGFISDIARCVFEDREGSLWVGTAGGGLVRLSDQPFTFLKQDQGLTSNLVWSIAASRTGGVWVGTANGVNLLRQSTAGVAVVSAALPGIAAWPVYEDRRGDLWVCAQLGALYQFPGGDLAAHSPSRLQLAGRCRSVAEDLAGALWFGTDAGLYRIQGSSVSRYTTTDGLAANAIRAIAAAPDGTVWIATSAGISRFRGGRFENSSRDRLPSTEITALLTSADGALWVGTYGAGLYRLAGGRFQAITTRSGLPDDFIYSIAERAGELWMTCRKGIIRAQTADVLAVINGTRTSLPAVQYAPHPVLMSTEFNYGAQPAVCRTADGRLWYPSYSGVVAIAAEHPASRLPLPVYIDQVIDNSVPVPLSTAARLRPGVHTLEFRYTAPSLLRPELVRFRYRLEGFDEKWIEADGRRTAYYTNVRSGSYTFRVTACNEAGIWNETGAQFAFQVVRPWYRTYWFASALFAAIALAAYVGHRWRVRALHQRQAWLESRVAERTAELCQEVSVRRQTEEELRAAKQAAERADRAKSEFLANMSHEIRTPLNGVIGMTSLLLEARLTPEQREHAQIVLRSGEALLSLINDILDFSKFPRGAQGSATCRNCDEHDRHDRPVGHPVVTICHS